MDSTNESAGKIIDSEFGDKPVGRSVIRKHEWWPEMLERVAELCEEAAKHEKQNLMALGQDYHKARETICLAKPMLGKIPTLTGKIEDLLKSHAMDKMPDLSEKTEAVESTFLHEYTDCKFSGICKYYQKIIAEGEH